MEVDMLMILILFGVIGGLLLFGMIGLFIGLVVLVIFYWLIFVWVNEVLEFEESIIEVVKYLEEFWNRIGVMLFNFYYLVIFVIGNK